MKAAKKLDVMDLDKVSGGNQGAVPDGWRMVEARVTAGYLALRSKPEYDDKNILYQIQNGRVLLVSKTKIHGEYAWGVIDDREGWVNVRYTIDLGGGLDPM